MNIGTWNVQGLSQKLNDVISESKNANMDIVVLTETKKKGVGSENLGQYDHFFSGVPKDKRAQQGVSILIRKNLRRCITSWEPISQRIIKMNLSIHGNKLTIIGAYAINDDALVKDKDEFFEQLSYEISKIGTSREIILIGDLNSRTGKKQQDKIVGQFGEDTVNDNGNRLINMCDQNNLRILNGFFQHREIHKYTWVQHSRNLKSIIDYVIVRQDTKLKIQDVRAYRGAVCGSDHHLVKSKILPFRTQKKKEGDTREQEQKTTEIRYNLDSLNHESVKKLYKKRLDEQLIQESFESTEDQYEYLKSCLKNAALEALGEYEKPNRRIPYWWDEEIEEMIKTKRDKYNKFLNTKSDQDKNEYKTAQRMVRTAITKKKNESWERNCTRLNTYLGGSRSTESWKMLRSLRQEETKDIISPITLEEWDKYFAKLLTEQRTEYQQPQQLKSDIQIRTASSPLRIHTKEVKLICQSLKSRKSPGPGNIPPELLKHGTEKLYRQLASLFQKCINGENLPEEWKTSYITTIHKKGNRELCDNYRGIAVLSTISRVYGKLVKKRIEDEYCDIEAEEQAGFRAGRSTVDHLFTITQIIEKKTARSQEIHLLYVDLKKAYDSVPQLKLWEALEKTNINITLIKAVQELYKDNTSKIKKGQTLSKGFNINKGLKQGCCLSPTLFKIYLEQALKIWKRKCEQMGIPLNDYVLYTLCFADDQIVLAQDYDDLEYMTRKLIEEYDKWGLEVNLQKTEYMCIGGEQQDLILEQQQQHQQIKQCKKYKYLGMHITNDGSLDEEIKHRNNQGRQAIRQLNSILWDKAVSKQNKHRIYNSIVKSIISYGSEVWPLKEKTRKSLEATEMDYWRRAAGKSKLERVRNERIREIMGVKHKITEDIQINQLRWYGHVQRMAEDRIPKKILNWTPQGRRKRGRPRLSWREGIDRDIRERGVDENLWTNRDQWRLEIRRRRRTL